MGKHESHCVVGLCGRDQPVLLGAMRHVFYQPCGTTNCSENEYSVGLILNMHTHLHTHTHTPTPTHTHPPTHPHTGAYIILASVHIYCQCATQIQGTQAQIGQVQDTVMFIAGHEWWPRLYVTLSHCCCYYISPLKSRLLMYIIVLPTTFT